MLIEELLKLAPWNEVHAIMEVDMSRTRNDEEFLGVRGKIYGVLAENPRMRLVARNEQDRAR
jgi:hypothetical protein